MDCSNGPDSELEAKMDERARGSRGSRGAAAEKGQEDIGGGKGEHA